MPHCERKFVRLVQMSHQFEDFERARHYLNEGLQEFRGSDGLIACAVLLAREGQFEGLAPLCFQDYLAEGATPAAFNRLMTRVGADKDGPQTVRAAVPALEIACEPMLKELKRAKNKFKTSKEYWATVELQTIYDRLGLHEKAWDLFTRGIDPGFQGKLRLAKARCATHFDEGFALLEELARHDIETCHSSPSHKYAPQSRLLQQVHEQAVQAGRPEKWDFLRDNLCMQYKHRPSYVKAVKSADVLQAPSALKI
jgi:hypothetical protein